MTIPEKSFTLNHIHANPSGWGPLEGQVSEDLQDVPYLPFSKLDKIGKVANWMESEGGRDDQRNRQHRGPEVFGAGVTSTFAYHHAIEDDATFSLVTGAAMAQKMRAAHANASDRNAANRNQRTQPQPRTNTTARPTTAAARNAAPTTSRTTIQGKKKGQEKVQRLRDASINIKPDWKILEEIDFSRLNKMLFEFPTEAQDLAVCGTLNYYDKSFDRLTTKAPKALPEVEKYQPGLSTTASKDSTLSSFESEDKKTVYVTDTVLSALMCATRSVYPWDIIVTKEDDKIWLDKRVDATLDIITVNENAAEPPAEVTTEKEIANSASNLANEATSINRSFIATVTKEDEQFSFKESNPWSGEVEQGQAESCAYRYRKIALGEDVDLFIRCTMDAVVHVPGGNANSASNASDPILSTKESSFPPKETLYATLKALLEFDPKPIPGQEWRKKLDSQRGAVVATEIKNNGNRLSRWTLEAILGGADYMRLGFVSRAHNKIPKNHQILTVITYKPREFASQMNLNLNAAWGIVKAITSHIFSLEDGKYALVRDPNKPVLRIYSAPSARIDGESETESDADE